MQVNGQRLMVAEAVSLVFIKLYANLRKEADEILPYVLNSNEFSMYRNYLDIYVHSIDEDSINYSGRRPRQGVYEQHQPIIMLPIYYLHNKHVREKINIRN